MSENTKPKILIVDDMPENLNILCDTLEPEGYSILAASNGRDAMRIATRALPDLILLDIVMNGMSGYEVCRELKQNPTTQNIPVIFITVKDDKESLVQGFQVGGVDYIRKTFEKEELLVRVENHLELNRLTRELSQKNEELSQKNRELQQEIERRERAEKERQQAKDELQKADEQLSMVSQREAERWGIEGFVGKSKTIRQILDDIRKLQNTETTSVLITGESGTGKELIARAIHFGGSRSKKPFIPVNCSAIPGELAESLLFGHAKGAFTGADASRKGYFELADGGTLFLDEIGDMPSELQPKLLRVLEDGILMPVGETREKNVSVRVIAATNQRLLQKIDEGLFREDLYFRLAGFTVAVPPLRQRKEDIPLLTDHFLNIFAAEMGREKATLSDDALSALMEYHFPGNIRELKNMVESAIIKSAGVEILPEHLNIMSFTSTPAMNNLVTSNDSSPKYSQSTRNNQPLNNQADFDAASLVQPKPQSRDFDSVQIFVDECCEIAPNVEIHKPEFLDRYLRFCHVNGYRPMSRNQLYKRVLDLYPQVSDTLIGKKRLAGFRGLRLKK